MKAEEPDITTCCVEYYELWLQLMWGGPRKQLPSRFPGGRKKKHSLAVGPSRSSSRNAHIDTPSTFFEIKQPSAYPAVPGSLTVSTRFLPPAYPYFSRNRKARSDIFHGETLSNRRYTRSFASIGVAPLRCVPSLGRGGGGVLAISRLLLKKRLNSVQKRS